MTQRSPGLESIYQSSPAHARKAKFSLKQKVLYHLCRNPQHRGGGHETQHINHCSSEARQQQGPTKAHLVMGIGLQERSTVVKVAPQLHTVVFLLRFCIVLEHPHVCDVSVPKRHALGNVLLMRSHCGHEPAAWHCDCSSSGPACARSRCCRTESPQRNTFP